MAPLDETSRASWVCSATFFPLPGDYCFRSVASRLYRKIRSQPLRLFLDFLLQNYFHGPVRALHWLPLEKGFRALTQISVCVIIFGALSLSQTVIGKSRREFTE